MVEEVLQRSFLSSEASLTAFHIIMEFDSSQIEDESEESSSFGLSENWRIHKHILSNGIPEKIELYAYFPKEILSKMIAYVEKSFIFAKKGDPLPPIVYPVLALDKEKIYKGNYSYEYQGTGYGYKHEFTKMIVYRRGFYLLRIYRLVKPVENEFFKIEISYHKSGKGPNTRTMYALNKFKTLTEIGRKLQKFHLPVLNPKDCSAGAMSISEFISTIETELKKRNTKKISIVEF